VTVFAPSAMALADVRMLQGAREVPSAACDGLAHRGFHLHDWFVAAEESGASQPNTAAQKAVASITTSRVLGNISRVKVASWTQTRYVPLQEARLLLSFIRP
jgi:hypothetical protein